MGTAVMLLASLRTREVKAVSMLVMGEVESAAARGIWNVPILDRLSRLIVGGHIGGGGTALLH